jgi:hypothetical protein
MQDFHGSLYFRQLVDEVHGEAFEKRAMVIHGILMVEGAHEFMIVAIRSAAVGMNQLENALFVE